MEIKTSHLKFYMLDEIKYKIIDMPPLIKKTNPKSGHNCDI